jgi:uncharacterized protein YcaQ
MAVMDRLGSLQFDPLDVTGRNHDLVLASRIEGYRREWTDDLLYEERRLYEAYNKGLSILPTAELPWHRLGWDRNAVAHGEGAFVEHDALVDELMDRIRRDGPLSSTDIEPRAAIEWSWRPTNQVRALLEALALSGVLGLRRREGNRRIYDLSERLFPADLLAERRTEHEQRRHKLLSRYRAHGLLGETGSAELWYGTAPGVRDPAFPERPTRRELLAELVEQGALIPVTVEGVRGPRFVLAEEVPMLEAAAVEVAASGGPGGRPGPADPSLAGVAFLAPLDPFVWDRVFLRSLYDFDYIWEVYVPAAKRRWGYYVLPVLFGDRLVGRIEPRADRKNGTLRVLDMWWEDGFDPLGVETDGFVDALGDALVAHARFLGLSRIALPRVARHRGLATRLRDRLGSGGRVRS